MRFHWELFSRPTSFVPLSTYLWYLIPLILVWTILSKIFNLYKPRRIGSRFLEIKDIGKTVTITLIIMVCLIYATRKFEFSRLAYIYFEVTAIGILSCERMLTRRFLKAIRKRGYNARFALVIGSGNLLDKLLHSISCHPELGVVVNGILTFRKEEVHESPGGIPIIGVVDDLEGIINRTKWDIIFVALPLEAHHHLEKILKILMGRMLDIKIIPDVYEYTSLRGGLDQIDDIPLVSLQTLPLFGWNGFIKRGFDVTSAFLLLVILSPFFLLISFLIKMTSKGRIFYVQDRMGMDGKVFKIYKFRTMSMESEKETGAVWAEENDPRRTKSGTFLRKFNLDELPQLWNVLKGEMSIVGPRPERPFFVEKFGNQWPQYMLRH